MTRKEQKEMRQKQILFKALELFVTKGFTETKISDIVKALDISVGLLFHYYESKEQLCLELVRMGAAFARKPQEMYQGPALGYFSSTLDGLYRSVTEDPMVSYMFVLMSQARRQGIPEEIRQTALAVDQMSFSAHLIEHGQADGSIKQGDPMALSFAFWCSVQGIMEQHLITPDIPLPDKEWLLDIIRNK
ncbi:MAG: TetR/AcrR family transcriptional regulator [Oscillospiraceae bacterium]|nr:TetR/AcrR family transcriptional regulator [Oscillospiraceae bacterium]